MLKDKTQEQVSEQPLSLRERLLLKDKGLTQVVQSVLSQKEPSPIQIEKPAIDIAIQDTQVKPKEVQSDIQDIEMQHRHRRRQIDESD